LSDALAGVAKATMKSKSIRWLAFLAVLTPLARADEKFPLLQAGREYYTNVSVTTVTRTDIYFTHSQGMGNAKVESLAADVQKRLGIDPAKRRDIKHPVKVSAPSRNKATSQTAAVKGTPVAGSPEPVAPKISAKSFRGSQAPSFFVEKWITPKPAMDGKFVLLDFWATWCPPCRKSIPHLNALQAKFKDQLVVVGLSDEPEAVIRRMVEPRIDYALAFDTSARTMREVEVRGIPHTILIDPKGIVRFEGMPHYLTENGFKVLLDRYGN
jgi:cytochrome c biogenesis protein CcmG/thiol:disulfide interchange protein DsbE